MLKLILLFLCYCSLVISQTPTVISRNQRLTEMSDKTKESIVMIENLIKESQNQMNEDFEICQTNAQNQNCSSLSVWEHERTKHSKNITNLEKKIEKYQDTIEKIMLTNQKQTQKKHQIIKQLLPKIQNLKDTIEYLQNIEWLITDTYINIENSQQSLMNLFDPKENSNKSTILAQLMHLNKDFHDPGAKPQQQDQLSKHIEKPVSVKKKFNQGPPLIDEDIFDGSNEDLGNGIEDKLFENYKPEKILKADKIKKGLDIPEHDDHAKEIEKIIKKYLTKQQKEEAEDDNNSDLNLETNNEAFKSKVKMLGKKLYERLGKFRDKVQKEEDSLVQAVADLEKAIYDLHHRHASQIVEIYLETKNLQREIYEKDDLVLVLDAKIHDCKNIKKNLKQCQQNKALQQEYISNLQAQKAINQGIVQDLNKLLMYDDKNVEVSEVKINLPKQNQKQSLMEYPRRSRRRNRLLNFTPRRQSRRNRFQTVKNRQLSLLEYPRRSRRRNRLLNFTPRRQSRRRNRLLNFTPRRQSRRRNRLLKFTPRRQSRRRNRFQTVKNGQLSLLEYPRRSRRRNRLLNFTPRRQSRRRNRLLNFTPRRQSRRRNRLLNFTPRRQSRRRNRLLNFTPRRQSRRRNRLLNFTPRRQSRRRNRLLNFTPRRQSRRRNRLLNFTPRRQSRRRNRLLNFTPRRQSRRRNRFQTVKNGQLSLLEYPRRSRRRNRLLNFTPRRQSRRRNRLLNFTPRRQSRRRNRLLNFTPRRQSRRRNRLLNFTPRRQSRRRNRLLNLTTKNQSKPLLLELLKKK